jgi:alanyl-tRNA synthetase
MKTKRLYIDDSYQIEFQAHVAERLDYEGRPAVVLDRTCFYPESGGQPWDTGTLNGENVIQVVEDNGKILHVLEKWLNGENVEGKIDWERRFDHMQQHAGQHVLSQAFCQVVKGKTLSFHLGEASSTVEIDIRGISSAQLEEIEDLSNRIVLKNLPILSSQVEENQAGRIPLRKPPAKSGTLRIIEVKNFDFSACGGTHPRRTGEIGLIKITGTENIRNNVRFYFLCGWRALRDYRIKNNVLKEAARMLSSAPEDLPVILEKSQAEIKEFKKEIKNLRSELTRLEAEDTIRKAGRGVVRRIFADKSPEEARFIALNIIRNQGFCVLFGIPLPERVHIILARSDDVELDMRELMTEISSALRVKGGGRPSFVEMSGEKTERLEDALDKAAALAEKKLKP